MIYLSLIDEKCHNYYYFLTNQITIPKNQALIQKLDQYGHVFIYQDTKEKKFLIIQVMSQIIYLIHHIQKVILNILIKS